MIRLANVDNYDSAVLLSSAKDFVPLVEFLETRSIRVLLVFFHRKVHNSIELVGIPLIQGRSAQSLVANLLIYPGWYGLK